MFHKVLNTTLDDSLLINPVRTNVPKKFLIKDFFSKCDQTLPQYTSGNCWTHRENVRFSKIFRSETYLQTHHVYSTLKRRGNNHFHVVSTWNICGVFVGLGVNFSPGIQRNLLEMIWKSSEVNWEIYYANLKIYLPDWPKNIAGVAFLYPLKTWENLNVFWCFQGV